MAQASAFPAFVSVDFDNSRNGFREFRTAAADAGRDVRRQFEYDMGEIQKVIARALTGPANAGGGLNFDTAGMRQAAQQAEITAQATREVARALEASARANDDNTASTRRQIQAAQAAANEAEQEARALNAKAATYERVQAEISRAGTQLQTFSGASRTAANSQRALQQASVGAGQQLQDIIISLQGGQRASTVFAQQLPQLTYAFSNLEGKVGAAARFLSGPWGIAVALGAGALGGLIDSLFRSESASGKLVLALDVQKNSYETLRRAVDEYNDSQRQTEELSYRAIKSAKEKTAANLKLAESELAVAQGRFASQDPGSKGGLEIKSAYGAQITQLQARIAELRKQLGEDISALISKDNQAAIDPVVAITRKWDEQIRNVTNAYEKLAATRRLTQREEEEWRAKELAFEKKKKAEIEAYRKAERASKRTGGANPTGELTSFISPVTGGRITSTPGIRRDPVNGKQAVHNGIDIAVPIGTSVRAPAQGVVIESGTIPGFGEAIFIDHGAGVITRLAHLSKRNVAKGDIVSQGDVIGLSGNTGKSTGPHVHWETRVNNRVVDPRGKRLPTDPLGAAQDSADMAEKAAKAAQVLRDSIDAAGQSIAQLRGQFDQAPRDIDKANVAAIKLDRTLAGINDTLKNEDLTAEQRKSLEDYAKAIEEIQKKLIPEFLQRPINDRIKGADQELQIQRLLLQGREEEANVLAFQQDLMRQLGVETQAQLEAELKSRGITKEKLDLLYAQQQQLRENARIQERMDRSVRSVGSKLQELDRARSSVEQAIAGLPDNARRALKDLVLNIRAQVNDIIARRIADNLFGDMFARIEDQIRGKKPIDAATANYVQSTVKANTALIDLTESFRYASSVFRGAANDNFSPLSKIVSGSKFGADGVPSGATLFGKNAGATSYLDEIIVRANNGKGSNVIDQLKLLNKTTRDGLGIDSPISKGIGGLLKNAAEGAFIGQTASSLIFGNKGSATGSAIGGALGKIAGEELGKVIGGTLGKFAGPVGAIAGGLLGSVVGGLFKKTPKGYAVITGGGEGDFSVTGNKSGVRNDLTTASGSVQQGLSRLAEMLGGDVGNFRVSIGEYKGWYRVSSSGSSDVGSKKYPKRAGSDLLYDGQDAEAAVRAAIADAIRDGAILGISQAQQRLIAANKDLEVGVQKALDFQSVFDRLKEYKDPVGAALDTLDKEFNRLKKIFAEAGASAADYASLEELYGIERAKAIKEASDKMTASLRSLYDSLTIGDSGRSLRDRLSAAQTAYDPLKARVLAGDKTAYDDFAKAAQDLLDIQRQFSGSQTPYFNLLDEITRITKERIDAEANIASIAQNRDSPFSSTGQATGANDNAAVVSAIGETNGILRSIATMLAAGGDRYNFGNFLTNDFR